MTTGHPARRADAALVRTARGGPPAAEHARVPVDAAARAQSPPVRLPQRLTEVTGPLLGAERVRRATPT